MRQQILESLYRRRNQIKESLLNEAEDEGYVASGRRFGGSGPFAIPPGFLNIPMPGSLGPGIPVRHPGVPMTADEINYGMNTYGGGRVVLDDGDQDDDTDSYGPGRGNKPIRGIPGHRPSGPGEDQLPGGRGRGGRFSRDDTRTSPRRNKPERKKPIGGGGGGGGGRGRGG